MTTTIGLDVGGTKIAGAVVTDGVVVGRARRETGIPSAESVASASADLVRELAQHHQVEGVGMAVAGFVDKSGAHVVYGTNLGMQDEPMKQRMESLVDLPVILDNDANAAAWGEFRYGAGKDSDDMLLVTVGTGIGGGIILDQRLLRGAYGFAAEIGHMRVVPGGPQCGCGNRGCWEMYASGSALLRAAKELVASGTPHASRLRDACGGRPKDLKGQAITELAGKGDLACIELLEDLGRWLGEGCASMTAILDPEMIVVGGGVVEAGDLLLDPARHAYARHLTARGHRPQASFVPARLGNDAGMIGAAAIAAEAFCGGGDEAGHQATDA
ncbi:ROK family glucokinase [Arsenicicoccus sp. oral taxon 190]|uniref:ROK family glucokinase n=1 Tax=Arsenicicoccus sp. oral taxon 190 TaxID=1658671 RepID=UPI00067A055C|nr:ROK family glucokinase [Arsenicicoccus sp. oral taxon 190]AKT52046.1 glucokinase [Arsenicicoccus sp. oral taxon 190]